MSWARDCILSENNVWYLGKQPVMQINIICAKFIYWKSCKSFFDVDRVKVMCKSWAKFVQLYLQHYWVSDGVCDSLTILLCWEVQVQVNISEVAFMVSWRKTGVFILIQ